MDINSIKGATSKGNQPKYLLEDNFIKLDMMGYESISEVVISEFLNYTNIPHVDYCFFHNYIRGSLREGCICKSFISNGESVVSLYRLLDSVNFKKSLKRLNGKDLLDYIIAETNEMVGLDVREYLRVMFTVDAIVLNEDRHLNNICLIKSEKGYKLAPLFDFGLSLLSDLEEYPYGESVLRLSRKVKCKPFSVSFKKQLGYFDIKPIVLDYDSFYNKIKLVDDNIKDVVPFKEDYYHRAISVLLNRLRETEGWLWIRNN